MSAQIKRAELAWENGRYGRRPLDRELTPMSASEFESRYLSPKEKGGRDQGVIDRLAVDSLGEIRGKKILDYCCGNGSLAIYLAQRGAAVEGFDLSPVAIHLAKLKAAQNGVSPVFLVGDADNLPYPNGHFDACIGFQALHHMMSFPFAAQELFRVLRPEGTAIFAEPWGGSNPLFQMMRYFTFFRRAGRSRGQAILSMKALRSSLFASWFEISVESRSFFYMAKRFVKSPCVLKLLRKIDEWTPAPEEWRGEAVIELSKKVGIVGASSF